jgi:hypothetical protein
LIETRHAMLTAKVHVTMGTDDEAHANEISFFTVITSFFSRFAFGTTVPPSSDTDHLYYRGSRGRGVNVMLDILTISNACPVINILRTSTLQ